MPYTIKHSDTTKNDILVNDNISNTETSLTFPGRNQRGYGIDIAENFLHLLENFSSATPPDNPIEGQLWFNSTTKELLVNDGSSSALSSWKPAGALNKGNSLPSSANVGDLFVNTTMHQLYLWTGTTWVLVGPAFGSGLKTGAIPATLKDSTGGVQTVILNYVNNEVVSIVSLGDTVNSANVNQPFYPNPDILGFSKIYPGVNIRQNSTGTGIANNKFWGLSEKAEALVDGSDVIPTASFLRSDKSNVVYNDFVVKTDGGLSLGSSNQLKLQVSSSGTGVIYHSTQNSAIEIKVNDGTSISKTVIKIDSAKKTVGINNPSPDRDIDVSGTGRFSGVVEVTDVTEASSTIPVNEGSTDTGALLVSGGITTKKSIRSGLDIALDGTLRFNKTTAGSALLPSTTNENLDIGSTTNKFRNVYANFFVGTLNGDVTGSITGNATTATALLTSTDFVIDGDITSDTISFNGTGGTKTFQTTLSSTFIDTKNETGYSNDSDFLIVYRPDDAVLYKIAKDNFVSNIATVPVGTILPFAGSTAPTDYLFCDGSEKSIGLYNSLFAVIGYTYGDANQLLGYNTFKLPDLRGRLPMGRNNMDNGLADTIPAKQEPHGSISAGGGVAPLTDTSPRVTEASAGSLGNVGGSETTEIFMSNLPLTSSNTESGTAVSRTAFDETKSVSPIGVINPYQTINYIIYAGRNAGVA